MNRREFFRAGALLGAGLGASCAGLRLGRGRRPNIVFVLADDLGYGDLGCYGQERIRTPHIDRMAAEGMRFTRHYSGSTVCAPSRATLMLGVHTGHLRTAGQGQSLIPGDVTVAEVLRDAGYSTGLVGKWGLGQEGSEGLPRLQGFETFYGYLNQTHAHNYYPAWLWRNEEKVPLRNEVSKPPRRPDSPGGYATARLDYSHDLFTREALEFIEAHARRPFFLYLAYTVPHANNEAGHFGQHGMEVPEFGEYADRDWPDAQKGHAAMISRLDRDIGALLAKLAELGLEDDTLVLLTSDNGPHKEGQADPAFFGSNGPLRGMKRDLYEGGIRVPMIARWPGSIAPGGVSDHISAFWDFLPTACDVAGIPTPAGLDGISYLPELTGRPQPRHDFLYWSFLEQGGKRALLRGDLKLVVLNTRRPERTSVELYDLAADIGERNDLAAGRPDLVADLKALMDAAQGLSEDG